MGNEKWPMLGSKLDSSCLMRLVLQRQLCEACLQL